MEGVSHQAYRPKYPVCGNYRSFSPLAVLPDYEVWNFYFNWEGMFGLE
jgi:hypothetical protein